MEKLILSSMIVMAFLLIGVTLNTLKDTHKNVSLVVSQMVVK